MSVLNKDAIPNGDKPSNRAAEMAEEAKKTEDKPLANTLLGDDKSGGRAGQGGMGGPAS